MFGNGIDTRVEPEVSSCSLSSHGGGGVFFEEKRGHWPDTGDRFDGDRTPAGRGAVVGCSIAEHLRPVVKMQLRGAAQCTRPDTTAPPPRTRRERVRWHLPAHGAVCSECTPGLHICHGLPRKQLIHQLDAALHSGADTRFAVLLFITITRVTLRRNSPFAVAA